ncbi:MAG: AIR synthase-related protein [Candidatus Gastranaerophilales bacterium]|nr:AIR synthase-related protein [Candidatus Gastranaerophilales bacterium]
MNLGKVSESVLKHSVLHQIHTRNEEVLSGAGIGADCAIFAPSGEKPAAVCVKEAAVALRRDLFCKGGDSHQTEASCISMTQLINRCANNLAVSGAIPAAVMIVLLLPQSVERDFVKELMQEAESACRDLSVQIAGGQSSVSSGVTVPHAIVTGYGRTLEERYCTVKDAEPGQDIVLSKWVGLEGTAILARRHEEKLLARYPAYLAKEAAEYDRFLSVLPEAALAMKSNVCAMHDASEGGIFAALWELAEGAGVGLTIDLKKIPLRQETVEVCECCGANPYELLSGGCLIMTAWEGDVLAETLRAEQIPAVVIGRITDGKDRIIRNEEEIRYMDRPKTDAIYQDFE